MHFKGKVAIVTGGSSGIGKEVAKRLVAHGASVVLGGRDEAKLHAAAKEISEDAGVVRILAGDIGKPATGVALVDFAETEFGGLDVLINNAGIFKPIPFADVTEQQFDGFLNTILKGKFFIAQAAAKAMKKRGGGAIVQTGSLWALQAIGATPSSAYSVANAGVHALVHNLALELAADKIRINAVAPGVVETPIYSTFLSKDALDQNQSVITNVGSQFHNYSSLSFGRSTPEKLEETKIDDEFESERVLFVFGGTGVGANVLIAVPKGVGNIGRGFYRPHPSRGHGGLQCRWPVNVASFCQECAFVALARRDNRGRDRDITKFF